MIRDVVWACIVCGKADGLTTEGKCRECGAEYSRGRGADIVVKSKGERRVYAPRDITRMLPDAGATGTAHCTVRDSVGDKPFYAHGRYLGRIEQLGPPRTGKLILTEDRLQFEADAGQDFDIPLVDITAIQPSSHALQLKTRYMPLFSIKMTDSSPKLWEERLQNAINAAYVRDSRGEVVEFQPRICTRRAVTHDCTNFRAQQMIDAGRDRRPEMPRLYRFCCWLARTTWQRFGGGIHVSGLENIPARGPFLVLPNHQSYLETMLVPAVMPRPVYAMAKSTQFNVPFFGWLMAQVFAFPVRRFEIDPQAIRFLMRRFGEGHGAMIFIEGERTWDGDVQAARHGVVRLALKTGIPVIPCRVDGAFEAWPRWSSLPQKNPVQIRFFPALVLPTAKGRAQREAHLDESIELIRGAISQKFS